MPRLYHLLCLILICALQTACASTKFNVLEINSLASQTSGTGEFEGLEYMAKRAPITATKRINIIFLHGIGISKAYDLTIKEKAVSSLCGRDETDEDRTRLNHIYIKRPNPKSFGTSIPGRNLELDSLVCMDKQVLPVGNNLEYVIYRIFWELKA